MKRIALGIAIAVVGVSGVAGATVAVNSFTQATPSNQSAAVQANGAGQSAGVQANAGTALPNASDVLGTLPDVAEIVPTVEGVVDTALNTVMGAIPAAPATPDVSGIVNALPSACDVKLPVGLPLPKNIFNQGMSIIEMLDSFATSQLGVLSALPLPNTTLVSVPDVVDTVKGELGCMMSNSAASPVPAACGATAGLPVSLPAPVGGLVNGAVGALTGDLAGITGQSLNLNGGSSIGVQCDAGAATSAVNPAGILANPTSVLPKVNLPKLPNLPIVPQLPIPDVTQIIAPVTDIVGSVVPSVPVPGLGDATGILNQVTGTVTSLLDSLIPSCSASGTASSGGLFGPLSALLSASC